MNAPPDVVPEGAKAVVEAHADLIGRWTYDLWIVDAEAWTRGLTKAAARKRLEAEGYRKSRARQLIGRARVRADNQARAIGRFG
jgi:hypothetical protein